MLSVTKNSIVCGTFTIVRGYSYLVYGYSQRWKWRQKRLEGLPVVETRVLSTSYERADSPGAPAFVRKGTQPWPANSLASLAPNFPSPDRLQYLGRGELGLVTIANISCCGGMYRDVS